jgi:hypothetical protein
VSSSKVIILSRLFSMLGILMLLSTGAFAWDPSGMKIIKVEKKSGKIRGSATVKENFARDKEGTMISKGATFTYDNGRGEPLVKKIALSSPMGNVWIREGKVYVNGDNRALIVDMKYGTIRESPKRIERSQSMAPDAPQGVTIGRSTSGWSLYDKKGQETPLVLPLTYGGRKVDPWPLTYVGKGSLIVTALMCQCNDSARCAHGAVVLVDGAKGTIAQDYATGLKIYMSRGYGLWTDPQVAIAEEVILAQTHEGVRAVDLISGKTLWTSTAVTLKEKPWDRAWQSGGLLLTMAFVPKGGTCSTKGCLAALDMKNGALLWRCTEPFTTIMSLESDNEGFLYILGVQDF